MYSLFFDTSRITISHTVRNLLRSFAFAVLFKPKSLSKNNGRRYLEGRGQLDGVYAIIILDLVLVVNCSSFIVRKHSLTRRAGRCCVS